MAEPAQPWTFEEAAGDGASKKDLATFLQTNGSLKFQSEHKIKGQLKSITKTRTKDQLVAAYKALFETKAFKQEGEDEEAAAAAAAKLEEVTEATKNLKVEPQAAAAEPEIPRYKKSIISKGDKVNYPKKGDTVSIYYTGKLADSGKVFDTNNSGGGGKRRKTQPIKFKIGLGKVIRGWDEGIMTMSAGEKAELIIEPEWGYGRKFIDGKPPQNVDIPKGSTLKFDVELVTIG